MSKKPKSGAAVRGSLITSAQWVGNVDDSMRDYQLRRKLGQGSEAPRSEISTDKIRVQVSGGPYDIGTPVEIGLPAFSAVSRKKDWHDAALRAGNGSIGIVIEPTASGKYTWCQVDGACPAIVDVVATTDRFADVAVGASQFTSGSSGPVEIISQPTTTGVQTLLVRFVRSALAESFYIRNEHSNLAAGRGLELGQVHSGDVIKADLRGDNTRAYCVLTEAIDANEIGRASVSGWTKARVNVTQLTHTHCYLPRGQVVFESNFGGPLELLRTPTATGEQDVLVRWQPLYRRRIVLTQEIDRGAGANHGTANVIAVRGGAQMSIGSIDAYLDWMVGGTTVLQYGAAGWATWLDDYEHWVIDAAECS